MQNKNNFKKAIRQFNIDLKSGQHFKSFFCEKK